jgi:hypothetical protein
MESVDILLQALQLVLRSVPVLIETQRRMAEYAQQAILRKG